MITIAHSHVNVFKLHPTQHYTYIELHHAKPLHIMSMCVCLCECGVVLARNRFVYPRLQPMGGVLKANFPLCGGGKEHPDGEELDK